MQPQVSIIMNCYNSERYLREAINSVLFQSYDNFELIICNNHSTDLTVEIACSYSDERIKLINTPKHCPLGEARNYAINYSEGQFIAFLDSDDLWYADKLRHQVDYMLANKEVDFIYTNYYFLYNYITGSENKKIAYQKNQPSGFIFNHAVTAYNLAISSVMLRADVLKTITHHFNPYFQQIEEFDLFTRILYKHQAGYIHIPLAAYRIHNKMNTIANPERGSIEYQDLLDSYSKMDSNFRINNLKIVQFINAKYLSYSKAKYNLLYGDYNSVRRDLMGYVNYDIKNFFLYLISIFPKKFVRYFLIK